MSGHIGVKVWVYRGDVLPEPKAPPAAEAPAKRAEPKERKGWRRAPRPPEAKIFEGAPQAAAPEAPAAETEPSEPFEETPAEAEPVETPESAEPPAGEIRAD